MRYPKFLSLSTSSSGFSPPRCSPRLSLAQPLPCLPFLHRRSFIISLLVDFSYHVCSKVNTFWTLFILSYNILDDAGPNLGGDRAPGSCGPNLSQDSFHEPPPDNVTLQHITSPGSMQLSPRWHLSVWHHHTYVLIFPLQIFIGQIWSSISQMWYFLTC